MIEFQTLGGARLRSGERELTRVLAQPKRLALLAYLAAHPGVYQRRDTLLALLWPDVDTARGRASLRNGLHFLRRHMGEGVILTRGDDDVAVDARSVWHDSAAFEAVAAAGRHAEALSLYAGEYLPGVFVAGAPTFDEWLDERRTRLRRMAVQAAFALSEAGDDGTVGAEEIEALRRAWELALFDERLARRLMTLLDRVGDRAGALEVYARVRQKLEKEFAAKPAPETEALVTRLCEREEAYALPVESRSAEEMSVEGSAMEVDRAASPRTAVTRRTPAMAPGASRQRSSRGRGGGRRRGDGGDRTRGAPPLDLHSGSRRRDAARQRLRRRRPRVRRGGPHVHGPESACRGEAGAPARRCQRSSGSQGRPAVGGGLARCGGGAHVVAHEGGYVPGHSRASPGRGGRGGAVEL